MTWILILGHPHPEVLGADSCCVQGDPVWCRDWNGVRPAQGPISCIPAAEPRRALGTRAGSGHLDAEIAGGWSKCGGAGGQCWGRQGGALWPDLQFGAYWGPGQQFLAEVGTLLGAGVPPPGPGLTHTPDEPAEKDLKAGTVSSRDPGRGLDALWPDYTLPGSGVLCTGALTSGGPGEIRGSGEY